MELRRVGVGQKPLGVAGPVVEKIGDSDGSGGSCRSPTELDRLGEVASFLTGRARRDRVTRHGRPGRLAGEDLAEPPRVARRPGQAERLSEVPPGRLRIGEGGDVAAGDERASQQGRVVDLARDRQGLLSLIQAVGVRPSRWPSRARSASARARTAAATSACCASRSAKAVSNQASPSRMRPRACHSGCNDDASVNADSMSEFSRLHPNAARRLSISMLACSTRCS